ncbi:MAG TPA: ATP-binding cassette domain-containing protein [Acidimicrobiales bacterium]|nr:ATP-binding cassette domain-containing protein [Acidimicrobiales bacterium]
MRAGRSPAALYWLGGLLVLYLAYPVGAFVYRVATGSDDGWNVAGLWSSLGISVAGATISVLIGVLLGIPLAYVLAHRRGWLVSAVTVVVQLPLAVPPLISGILLIYIAGPYTFLGRLSGERLTQTFYGVIIAQSFVSLPFLVVVARSAFHAVDPALGEVAATLGHGPLARFLRVDVPAAGDGLRTGMVLMWLRAFGEYGTTVVLAYHPYSLPVYVDNLFSSAPLSQAEAPTILAFAVAVVAVGVGRIRRVRRTARRPRTLPAPMAPALTPPTPVGFDLSATVGTFRLQLAHPEGSHRLAVVGPSGSGKSLTLRALAGLLGPAAGPVSYGGEDVSLVRPHRRRVGYVPQGFGLVPGRTVWQQVVFGVEADPARAAWWLQTLGLDQLLDRYPEELSGGQRQRVSLARALAPGPRVVLLDEPLSALDTPVRAELRRELRRLQHDAGLSTVLVTHDPEEAAMLADEIVVVDRGRVLQSGPCRSVYRRPASLAVGRLLGIDNLAGGWAGEGGTLVTAAGTLAVASGLPAGTPVLWQVEPEAVRVEPEARRIGPEAGRVGPAGADGGPGRLSLGAGVVADVVDLGRVTELTVLVGDALELRARTMGDVPVGPGQRCVVSVEAGAVSVWAGPAAEADPPAGVDGAVRPPPGVRATGRG